MSAARLLVGDVFSRLREIPDGSVDLVLTSPPFLALRSYLPADHPDKAREIGSEATPAEYLETLLRLTAEWRRVLAPHGSIAVELGDTYAGSGGAGGDYHPGGQREGQPTWTSPSARTAASASPHASDSGAATNAPSASQPSSRPRTQAESHQGVDARNRGNTSRGTARRQREHPGAWPLDKSLCGVPTLYAWSLAYGRNLLTGEESPAGMWRIRTLKPWIRTNPPVGALGDKERPATSYVIVATKAVDRYFDLDAVRVAPSGYQRAGAARATPPGQKPRTCEDTTNGGGAPPLDWYHEVDGVLEAVLAEFAGKVDNYQRRTNGPKADGRDGVPRFDEQHETAGGGIRGWHLRRALEAAGFLSTAEALDVTAKGYRGAHYAVWPPELCRLLIEEMCPRRVCCTCGQPSRRVTTSETEQDGRWTAARVRPEPYTPGNGATSGQPSYRTTHTTTGWTTCGCPGTDGIRIDGFHTGPGWRPGLVLDPFAGSGTTLMVAHAHGRASIGVDLDSRNADLARQRIGMFLDVDQPDPQPEEATTS